LSILSIVFIFSIKPNNSSVFLNIQVHKISKLPVSSDREMIPGTLSIRPETMMRMICDIAEWLYRSGIRKILLLNGHMWNWGPLYSARENIHYDFLIFR
jgi:hypothetical protein